MRDTAASRNNLLPYPVITAAVQGDPDAEKVSVHSGRV